MKKLLLIPALVASVAMADQKKYEISPMIGYNMTEGNVGIKDDGHFLGGLEVQFNSKNSKISPEFSVLYSPKAKYDGSNPDDTTITRGAFNGVYTFDEEDDVVPFAKMGIGIESVRDEIAGNDDGFFADAGAGVKYSLTDSLALKAEALYMAKVSGIHNESVDNNLIAMVGLTFTFGEMEHKPKPKSEPKVESKPKPVPVVVDGDDDQDGVKNSVDKCPNTPEGIKVDGKGCAIDSDNDGVFDSNDKCPGTASGVKVDEEGCPLDSDNDGVFDSYDKCPDTEHGIKVGADGCALDSDKDGVVDTYDECPNTPAGEIVKSNGCPKTVNLAINFENNSATIKESSNAKLDKYADFLKKNKNYSAVITGYTDDRGSAEYNKKLSLKRAKAVVDALVARGVEPSRLTAEGMGEANPVADNATPQGRAQNRRIEAALIRH